MPETRNLDGQTERTNQILTDMLGACVLNFSGDWDDQLPLMEFAYNNSFQSSIQMAPIEALYGRSCRNPVSWEEVGKKCSLHGPELIETTRKNVLIIEGRLRTSQTR